MCPGFWISIEMPGTFCCSLVDFTDMCQLQPNKNSLPVIGALRKLECGATHAYSDDYLSPDESEMSSPHGIQPIVGRPFQFGHGNLSSLWLYMHLIAGLSSGASEAIAVCVGLV